MCTRRPGEGGRLPAVVGGLSVSNHVFVDGESGNDDIYVMGSAQLSAHGGKGDDYIDTRKGTAKQYIYGGEGNDEFTVMNIPELLSERFSQ